LSSSSNEVADRPVEDSALNHKSKVAVSDIGERKPRLLWTAATLTVMELRNERIVFDRVDYALPTLDSTKMRPLDSPRQRNHRRDDSLGQSARIIRTRQSRRYVRVVAASG